MLAVACVPLFGAASATGRGTQNSSGSDCLAHHPQYIDYATGCTGHDEPELDPLSSKIYPWYTLGKTGFHYGVDFPDTTNDFGQADQFQQTELCGGPFGPDTTYCATQIK
jgi:hypothetical protein